MILQRAAQKLYSAALKLWLTANAGGSLQLGKGVELGRGVRLVISDGGLISIGSRTLIEPGCLIHARGCNLDIGADCFIGQGTVIVANADMSIGADCLIAENVTIRDSNHNTTSKPYRLQGCTSKPVSIGQNVWLGAGAVVLPGVTLGDDVIAGAGAVVTKSFPQGAKVVGMPAKAY
jgi:acetyltransferase-like isoleucine patch superfamily enzyme